MVNNKYYYCYYVCFKLCLPIYFLSDYYNIMFVTIKNDKNLS